MMLMRIKDLREAAGMTQVALAEALGTMQGTISQWESETCLPRVRQLPQLAEIFECSIGDLFAPSESVSA